MLPEFPNRLFKAIRSMGKTQPAKRIEHSPIKLETILRHRAFKSYDIKPPQAILINLMEAKTPIYPSNTALIQYSVMKLS